MSKEIELTRGYYTVVDDEDFEELSKHKWSYSNGYATRIIRKDKNCRTVKMHRVIMGFPEKMDVDHIDGNKLDNRRCNLRQATRSQNMANMRVRKKKSKTGVIGIRIQPNCKRKFMVQIGVKRKQVYIGVFSTLEEAILARNAAMVDFFGEFANNGEKPPPQFLRSCTGSGTVLEPVHGSAEESSAAERHQGGHPAEG